MDPFMQLAIQEAQAGMPEIFPTMPFWCAGTGSSVRAETP